MLVSRKTSAKENLHIAIRDQSQLKRAFHQVTSKDGRKKLTRTLQDLKLKGRESSILQYLALFMVSLFLLSQIYRFVQATETEESEPVENDEAQQQEDVLAPKEAETATPTKNEQKPKTPSLYTTKTVMVSMFVKKGDDCLGSIESLFSTAEFPKRIQVLILEAGQEDNHNNKTRTDVGSKQNEDIVCLSNGYKHSDIVKDGYAEQILQYGNVNSGMGYLRETGYKHFMGKNHGTDFLLESTSHCLFTPHWDTHILEMWHSIPAEAKHSKMKSVITGFPASTRYYAEHELHHAKGRTSNVLCSTRITKREVSYSKPFELRSNKIPLEIPFYTQRFAFYPTSLLSTIKHDIFLKQNDHHDFYSLWFSARLWTNGYKMYAPNRDIVYLNYQDERRSSIEYRLLNMETWASRRFNDTCHIWQMWALSNNTFKFGTKDGPTCPPLPKDMTLKSNLWKAYGIGGERALKDYMNMINLKWEDGPSPKLIHRRYFTEGRHYEGNDKIPKHLRELKRATLHFYNPNRDATLCILINEGLFNSDDFAVTKM